MKESKLQQKSDFWWLTSEEARCYKYVCVRYQEPYSDSFDSDREPLSVPKYYSLDVEDNLSALLRRYPVEFIHQWREKCHNVNVFRSLALFTTMYDGNDILGPFVMDIDREDESESGYVQNLGKALKDVRSIVEDYLSKFKETDFRIFFTGHKGFNIEVRPLALGITTSNNQWQQFCEIRNVINKIFGDSFIDNIHKYIRLRDSINRWLVDNYQVKSRMKFELSVYELKSMTADEICQKSEKLALDYLSAR